MFSAKSLAAKGSISPKQMHKLAVLKGTRSQKSKMAPFEHKDKDEGQAHGLEGRPGRVERCPVAGEVSHDRARKAIASVSTL